VVAASTVLGDQGADFALIGGLALDAWGIPRATKDADCAVPVGAAEKRRRNCGDRPARTGRFGSAAWDSVTASEAFASISSIADSTSRRSFRM
jgi:hypothetical protein